MRTHKCGDLNTQQLGETVSICGWVHRRRDHGGVIFIDLRDRAGLVQVVIDPDLEDVFSIAEQVRSEYVLQITGIVRDRPQGTVNNNMHSGAIEILAKDIVVLNESETPPFPIESDIEVNEELRGDPSLANTDPLGKGWFFKVKLSNPSQTDALLDETAYNKFSAG